VKSALCRRTSALWISGVAFAALMAGAEPARADPLFPALFELRSLYPAFGGDGSAGFILHGIDTPNYSGGEVRGAGDVNGDGTNDVLINANGASPHGQTYAGEIYLVFGRRAGFPAVFELRRLLPAVGGDGSEGVVLRGIDARDYAGSALSGAGDINGDGVGDLIIGASKADIAGREAVGECYVVFGRRSGFPAVFELRGLRRVAGGDGSEGFILKGIGDHHNACNSVSDAGDVNGDGMDDLLLSATSAGGPHRPGQAYVVFGRTSGFPAEFALRELLPQQGGDGTEGFVIEAIEPYGHAGRSVSGAGDVNGDGVDDVLIGSSNAQENAGETYVVFGRSTGFQPVFALRDLLPQQGGDGSEGFVLRGAETFDFAGDSVSGAGDVNGDGVDDLLIGAYGVDPDDRDNAGASYLIFGRTTGFPPILELRDIDPTFGEDGSAGVVFAGGAEFDRAGNAVSGAGDVNGDGIEDLMIGAEGADPGGTDDAGETYIVFGRRTGFPAVFELQGLNPGGGGDGSEGFVVAGARVDDVSGNSVSDAGDVNGDGVDDLVIGASHVDPGGRTSAGASYVVFGRR
jgi:hypothetical protein